MKWICPECGFSDLRVEVTATARLIQDGNKIETEIVGSHDWDGESRMLCNDCEYEGKAWMFEER